MSQSLTQPGLHCGKTGAHGVGMIWGVTRFTEPETVFPLTLYPWEKLKGFQPPGT